MSYCHFWYVRQRTTLNLRRVRGQQEISTRRESQQIAVTSTGKMCPGFLAAFLLFVVLNSPMVKPGEIARQRAPRRQQFKLAIHGEDRSRSKFRQRNVAGEGQIADAIGMGQAHSEYRVTTSATKTAAS